LKEEKGTKGLRNNRRSVGRVGRYIGKVRRGPEQGKKEKNEMELVRNPVEGGKKMLNCWSWRIGKGLTVK